MTVEEKTQKAIEYLSRLIYIDLNDAKQKYFLLCAIRYANLDTYSTEVKSNEQDINNDIFTIKATSFWRRKMLDQRGKDYVKDSISLKAWEYNSVRSLMMKLPPNLFLT